MFGSVLAYCVAVRAACGCLACCVSAGGLWHSGDLSEPPVEGPVPSADFQANDRWRDTATEGDSIDLAGEPVTVTWGVVADGTMISRDFVAEQPSGFVAMMNGLYGSSRGGIAEAPWFPLMEQAFGRWEELTGIDFEYESADGGERIDATSSPRGSLGAYADIRIGGYGVDGGGGTLAFAWFPDNGDIVFDTNDGGSYGNGSNNSRFFRNVLMHEIGHSIGLSHLESNNSAHLMEPTINTSFDGPQLDDILGAQRIYGDVLEKEGGNDEAEVATELGSFGAGDSFAMGLDAGNTQVDFDDTDFVSIDGETDTDFFRFTVSEPTTIIARMIQQGPTYNEGPQNGDQTPLVANQLNDLSLALMAFSEDTLETLADGVPLGRTPGESVSDLVLTPGEYFLRIVGAEDNVQLYSLELSFTTATIPEPSCLALATALLGFVARRGRRR